MQNLLARFVGAPFQTCLLIFTVDRRVSDLADPIQDKTHLAIAATLCRSRFSLRRRFFFGAQGVVEADADDTKEDAEIQLHKNVPGGLWREATHNSISVGYRQDRLRSGGGSAMAFALI
jgi:hypothetical protein